MVNTKREEVREFEVFSLDGMDRVTLIINGQAFIMNVEVAKVLASDIRKGVKRAEGK